MTIMPRHQGCWGIVYFGHFFQLPREAAHTFGLRFFRGKSFCIIFDKKWPGLHFGRLFEKLIWSP
jgi:hypothetical protein